MINSVTLAGNLTRDPEVRQTGSGMAVLNMGIAVNERRKNNQTGQWEDKPCFVDLVMFGTRAQAVSQYLHKGLKVAVQGKLSYSSWQDKQGNKRSKLEVLVDELEFMSQRQGGQQGYQQPQYAQPVPQSTQQVYGGNPNDWAEPVPWEQ